MDFERIIKTTFDTLFNAADAEADKKLEQPFSPKEDKERFINDVAKFVRENDTAELMFIGIEKKSNYTHFIYSNVSFKVKYRLYGILENLKYAILKMDD